MAGFEVTLYGRFWVTPEGKVSKLAQLSRDLKSDCARVQVDSHFGNLNFVVKLL